MSLPTLCPPPPADFPQVSVKAQPEDFIVEEIPLYEPSGSGTHSYFWIEKRNLNTHDAARRLAALIGKRAPDAGVAGLKDAHAITRQWITFEHVAPEALEKALALNDPQLRVWHVTRHANKLKMGHLRGNRFIIRLRTADEAGRAKLAARADQALPLLCKTGLPNYFGPQRFGRYSDNAALGRLLVQGNLQGFQTAFAQAHASSRPPDRRLRNLLVNAFQSELFNRVLAQRMPEIGKLLSGDLAYLHRNGAVFKVADDQQAQVEQVRANAFELSPSGPMFGPEMPMPEGRPGEIEREVLSQAGVSAADFGRREAERQPGARRALRVPLLETVRAESDAQGLTLHFALPSGCYASVLIRELIGGEADPD